MNARLPFAARLGTQTPAELRRAFDAAAAAMCIQPVLSIDDAQHMLQSLATNLRMANPSFSDASLRCLAVKLEDEVTDLESEREEAAMPVPRSYAELDAFTARRVA